MSGYHHFSVNHNRHEYFRADPNGVHLTTNGVEAVRPVLKRCVRATWHRPSPEHVDRYCVEVTFRLNEGAQCFSTLEHMEALILKSFHRTITYKHFVGGTTEHVVRPHLRPRRPYEPTSEQITKELSVFDAHKQL